MIRWLQRLRQGISSLTTVGCSLLFPPRCACCHEEIYGGEDEFLLCPDCLAHLGPETWQGCRRCGAKVADDTPPPERCPLCRNAPLKFDAAVTLGSYHAGLRDVILRMKRPSHEPLSVAMGQLLIHRRREQLLEHQPDVVIPIPMFWTRRFSRGMNSPEILATCLGRPLGIPVQRDILVRHVNTLPQANLPPSRRFQNVKGAFRVRRPDAVKDARVLLVDDVLTTGATCSEAAKMLKQAGASAVAVAVVARAMGR